MGTCVIAHDGLERADIRVFKKEISSLAYIFVWGFVSELCNDRREEQELLLENKFGKIYIM